MFDWRKHWPKDKEGEAIPLEASTDKEVWDDLERCGHWVNSQGMRIYPERYVVLSEVDIERIAEAVVRKASKPEQVADIVVDRLKEWIGNAELVKYIHNEVTLEPLEVREGPAIPTAEEIANAVMERIALVERWKTNDAPK